MILIRQRIARVARFGWRQRVPTLRRHMDTNREKAMSGISNEDRLTIYELAAELIRRVIAGTVPFARVRDTLVMLIEDRADGSPIPKTGEKKHLPKLGLAEARRLVVENWYRGYGFNVTVPKPAASDRDFARWADEDRILCYRPPTSNVPYEAFMHAVGQGNHWTVVDEDGRANISWEPTVEGYWFLMYVGPASSILNNPPPVKSPSIEEYAIAYWMQRVAIGIDIDAGNSCRLRTRFGTRGLAAFGRGGAVYADGCEFIALPPLNEGTVPRAVEVVPNAA